MSTFPAGEPLAEDLRRAASVLERVAADWSLLDVLEADDRARLQRAVAALASPDRKLRRERQKAARARQREAREAALECTGIRTLRRKPVYSAHPEHAPPALAEVEAEAAAAPRDAATPARRCYVCKREYATLHFFYDQLCPECAAFNYAKRGELADLSGRVALLTGGRVKIGYQAGLKLLRAGAELIVTTRFPRDAVRRYAAEPDYAAWAERLTVYGLDLRHTPSVEAFCAGLLATRPRLDFIINNACQTVRRPPAFYAHMLAAEGTAGETLPAILRPRLGHFDATIADASLPARVGADLADAARLSQLALLPGDEAEAGALFAVTGVPAVTVAVWWACGPVSTSRR